MEINEMAVWELLEFILFNPEYLSDSYYRDIRKEIESRYNALRTE